MGIKNRRKIIDDVTGVRNFVIGNIRGAWYPTGTVLDCGKLPAVWADLLRADMEQGITYVVWSYATPIAWHPAGGVNRWIVPDERYSETTDHHVSLTRQAIKLRGERIEKAVAEAIS